MATDPTDLCSDGMLTVNECAEFLRLSRASVYKIMERGELIYAQFGTARRIPKRAAAAFAAANLTGGWAMAPHSVFGGSSQVLTGT